MKKNKRKSLGIAFGTVFLLSVFSLAVLPDLVSASTWVVNDQGGGDFTSINAALNNPNLQPGDIIQVQYGSGTYNENNPLTIPFGITMVGVQNAGQNPSIVANNNGANVITISSGVLQFPVLIENFNIRGATGLGFSGIYSQATGGSTTKITLQNLNVYSNYHGIRLSPSTSYHVISACNIYSNTICGLILKGNNHEVSDCGSQFNINTGIFNNGNDGISSDQLSFSTIEDTNVYDNGGSGISITANSMNNDITNVEIWNNDYRGLKIVGDNNDIDGKGNRKILNNFYSGATGSNEDVLITGDSNVIKDYTVRQNTDNELQDRTGIVTINDDSSNPNQVESCVVNGYDGTGCIGVRISGGDKVLDINTEIYGNKIGIKAGDSSASSTIDCDNTNHADDTENIYDNEIGVKVVCDNCIIKETYFYYSPVGANDYIGVLIDNEYNSYDADIDDCKFEKMGIGVKIKSSTGSYSSNIDDCTFQSVSNCGIYIDSGNYDNIGQSSACSFSYSGTGIKLIDSSDIDIEQSTFTENTGDSSKFSGVYCSGVTDIIIDDCTFDGHLKGVWFEGSSSSNEIKYCDFKDDNDPNYGGDDWGENDCEIGVYIKDSDNNKITESSFDNIDFAIGIQGSDNIDIFGDTINDTPITNCNKTALYATYSGSDGSSGTIRDYKTDLKVRLYGTDSENTTFEYSSLGGSADVSGNDYYSWTEET